MVTVHWIHNGSYDLTGNVMTLKDNANIIDFDRITQLLKLCIGHGLNEIPRIVLSLGTAVLAVTTQIHTDIWTTGFI